MTNRVPSPAPLAAEAAGEDPDAAGIEATRALARLARLLDRATGELGIAQYRVLAAIASGDERASRVAERLELGRPAVSAAVDALCRDGHLLRAEAPGDQRAVTLTVTPSGRAELARVESGAVRLLRELDRLGTTDATGALAALGPAMDALHRQRHDTRRSPA